MKNIENITEWKISQKPIVYFTDITTTINLTELESLLNKATRN